MHDVFCKRNATFYYYFRFRYDYVDDLEASKLPGFTELISNGVKAKWVNPLYPTVSYPSWTTLSTGLFAESHNIVGNYFYDAKEKDSFSLFDNDATGKPKVFIFMNI